MTRRGSLLLGTIAVAVVCAALLPPRSHADPQPAPRWMHVPDGDVMRSWQLVGDRVTALVKAMPESGPGHRLRAEQWTSEGTSDLTEGSRAELHRIVVPKLGRYALGSDGGGTSWVADNPDRPTRYVHVSPRGKLEVFAQGDVGIYNRHDLPFGTLVLVRPMGFETEITLVRPVD